MTVESELLKLTGLVREPKENDQHYRRRIIEAVQEFDDAMWFALSEEARAWFNACAAAANAEKKLPAFPAEENPRKPVKPRAAPAAPDQAAKTDDTRVATPHLDAYIARIGAEELNFKRFMIKVHKGNYYTERALIKITDDGAIWSSSKEYAPSKEEAAAIKEELKGVTRPKSILAKNTRGLEKLIGKGATYEFWDRHEKGIIMVQQRIEPRDKPKFYLPWTFWSDGEWRKMEPERNLPFWKPLEKRSGVNRIMVHEGAKAAAAAQRLVDENEVDHPWYELIRNYEHWGMIGGALVPHRADYAELWKENPTEVVYVCDNDWPGKSVLQEFSRHYGRALKGVMFDARFPLGWDIADPIPKNLYSGKRYIGPRLWELMQPATRATKTTPNPNGTGRPVVVLEQAFREEWFHSVEPEVFVHQDYPSRVRTMREFNNAVRPYSDVDDTARLLMADAASKSAILRYSPALKSGIYGSGEGGRFINTHEPTAIEPEKGDPKPWLDFMEHLVPEPGDREELMRWCATLIACPEVKMSYGVLLISETQGVGKGTLGEKILAPLIGASNVSYPSENEIVDSNFNYWLAHKRLAVVHEIYAGHSAKAYNRLKSVVTDKYITVSKKYLANYEIENWMHVFACSNSLRAIQLSMDDRRWFVPKITDEKKPSNYWTDLNFWLTEKGGLQIIKHWAHEWVSKHEAVTRGESAPWSALKREVVEEGYSPGMTLVSNFLTRVREEMADPAWARVQSAAPWANGSKDKTDGVVILDVDLVRMIKNHLYDGRHNDRLEKTTTVRKIAKSHDWFIGEQKAAVERWGTKGMSARAICSSAELACRLPEELSKSIRALDVDKLAQEWKL